MNAGIRAAVHELEELNRELDVANPAAPALHFALDEPAPPEVGLAPALHRADLAHDVGPRDVGEDALLGLT